jgi:hypothetical protein
VQLSVVSQAEPARSGRFAEDLKADQVAEQRGHLVELIGSEADEPDA